MLGSIAQLRRQHIDLCVNLYSGGGSAAYSFFTGARIRLGFDHTKSLRRFNNLLVKKDPLCGKWVRGLAETLRPLGIDPDSIPVGTTYTIRPQSRVVAQEILEKYKNKKIVCYCRSGNRSIYAALLLQNQGFNVVNLKGGLNAWRNS